MIASDATHDLIMQRVLRNERYAADSDDGAASAAFIGDPDRSELISFVCECGDETCVSVIRLTAGEYDHVRSDQSWLAVAPGHEPSDAERVLDKHMRFVRVQKPA
jgi:hypothetical protein